MPAKIAPHFLKIVLKLPKRVGDFITRAQQIHDTMAANGKSLPAPVPALPVLQASIDDLVTKESAAKDRTKGAVTDRNVAMKLVVTHLNNERAYLEQLANADPTNAEVIAGDASMTVRKPAPHPKSDLVAKHTASSVSGTVHLVARATKGAKAYNWQYSIDGGKTWTSVPPTTKASTSIANLPLGTSVSFRHNVLTKAGLSDWGQPISVVVV
jgi:hypothetical protein